MKDMSKRTRRTSPFSGRLRGEFTIFDEDDRRIVEVNKPLNVALPEIKNILESKFGERNKKRKR